MKISATGLTLLAVTATLFSFKHLNTGTKAPEISKIVKEHLSRTNYKKSLFIHSLYNTIAEETSNLSEDVFQLAFNGFEKLSDEGLLSNDSILTIIDYSLSSKEKRMYVIDIRSQRLLYYNLVAHGKNSGDEYAYTFSNAPNSHKSSLGFYRTANTYLGSNGYSLVLEGLEKGFNDKAKERSIVLHGADYANENIIKTKGYLGRSFGCPAIPTNMNKKIIETIKGGNCVFVFFPDQQYLRNSEILNG